MNEQQKINRATFGAGCFWHVEEEFRHLKGVLGTTVGYMGGILENPTYKDVCTNKTGHAEVVEVEYNPEEITYDALLDVFWKIHDPTTPNRQGVDVGSQYRSVVFYHSTEQEEAARSSKERLGKSEKYLNPVVTEIIPAAPFWRAEEYHQRYFEKTGLRTCGI